MARRTENIPKVAERPLAASEPPLQEDRAALVRTQRIPERIAADIRRRILTADIAEANALPAEVELIRMYGVSRPTLREALRILEAEQLIQIRRGGIGGAVIRKPSLPVAARQFGFVLQHHGVTMADVHRARTVIEPPALSALALTVTPEQIVELRGLLEQTNNAIGDPLRYSRNAEWLRETIVTMTGQITLAMLMQLLREVVQRHTAAIGGHPPDRWTKLQRLSLRSHARLLDLIEAHDTAGAEEHWKQHLARVEQTLGRGAATQVVDLLD